MECEFRDMSAQGVARAWAGDGALPELVSVVVGLYVVNLALHALVFSSEIRTSDLARRTCCSRRAACCSARP